MVEFSLSSIKHKYVRIVYTFWNLLEDMGGICEVFVAILGLFLYSYTETSFSLLAISKFYNHSYNKELDEDSQQAEGGSQDQEKA